MFKGKASFTEEKVQQHFALVNQAYNAGKVGSKWDSARTSETLSLPDLAAFIRSMDGTKTKDKDALIVIRDICDHVEFAVLALEHARLHLALCDLMARAKTCHAVRETAASILHSMCGR